MSEYIELKEIGRKPKTTIYGVFSRKDGAKLGEIKWFARWRQFAFFPERDTIWNDNCLVDVIHFIHKASVDGRRTGVLK